MKEYLILFLSVLFLSCNNISEPNDLYVKITDIYGVDAISSIVEYETNGDMVYVLVNDTSKFIGEVPIGKIEFWPTAAQQNCNSIVLFSERNTQSISIKIR